MPLWFDTTLVTIGLLVLVSGGLKVLLVPFAVWFELSEQWGRRRRSLGRAVGSPGLDVGPGGADAGTAGAGAGSDIGPAGGPQPGPGTAVSVVVPGYNEGRVLRACVRSLVASEHRDLEVILVDDGSTDDTFAVMTELAAEHPRVRAVTKPNGGKGSALNVGIALATGDVLILSDADGVYRPDAVTELLRGFADPGVGAVCGDDRPVNLDRLQTRFLSVISHVGTGLVRRALHVLRCLPIVSGNIGAFRREVLAVTGPLDEHTLGEDLELTWRVYRHGYRVAFAPRAVVYAESPSTLKGLWRQRVRWGRGLLQVLARHRDMVGNPRFGVFGLSLPLTALAGVGVPVLQLLVIAAMGVSLAVGHPVVFDTRVWEVALWLGIPLSVAMLLLALGLNRAWGDLRFAPTLLLWPLYSTLMSAVMLQSLSLEARRAPQRWNKLERTGVVSIDALGGGMGGGGVPGGNGAPSPSSL